MLQRAAERLSEDESLRSNLDDQQASAVLQHALSLLENRLNQSGVITASAAGPSLEQELAHITKAMRAVNDAMGSSHPPALPEALEKLLPLAGTVQAAGAPSAQNTSLVQRAARRLRAIWRRAVARDTQS
jgi:hypothetical protein